VGAPWVFPDLESPGVLRDGDRYVLWYSRGGVVTHRADSLAADWSLTQPILLDREGSGAELAPSGDGYFLSRRRTDWCNVGNSLLWTDSLDTSGYPFGIVPWPRLPGFTVGGDAAFLSQPNFGDGQAFRGETPAQPAGMFWLSSRESNPEPYHLYPCGRQLGPAPTGTLRSDPFVLAGDTVAVRVNGADSPDSAYVVLRDVCTGAELVRFTGGGEALPPRRAHVGVARGRRLEWRIADRLTRPGGWIGLDDLEERASPGLGPPPAPPQVRWLAPAGGENLAGGEVAGLQWEAHDDAGLDSLVLYLTYDGGETLWRQAAYGGAITRAVWSVPDTLLFGVRLRLVAYARSGVSACATTEPFRINAAVAVGGEAGAGAGGLRAVYGRDGVWLEGVARGGRADAPGDAPATLAVYDLRGREVAVLWRGRAGEAFRVSVCGGAGRGTTGAPGVYFARLRCGAEARRATFVRPAAACR